MFDVAVIGAGVAGLHCARLLGARGLRVALIDRKRSVADNVQTTGIFVRKTWEDFALPAEQLGAPIRRVTLYSTLEWQAEEDDISPLATLSDSHPLPDEVAEFNELQRRLMCAIQSLPTKFRSVVLLRYIHQYSFSEIGQVLEMPMTSAKTYYYRACSKLRTFLVSR